MCPRIDGEYSGSSSVGSQPNSHVVSPLQPRRPLRFSTLLALDVRRPRGEVHRIPAAPPRADRYRRSPLSLFCSGLPSPPRPASAMGFRASRASPAGIAVELKSPGASGSAATGRSAAARASDLVQARLGRGDWRELAIFGADYQAARPTTPDLSGMRGTSRASDGERTMESFVDDICNLIGFYSRSAPCSAST
jgi:hypothetical protein